ncbi:hypothetical protein H072_6847 [Dactylellina haptotyla CBS 200.50]|uniref:Uncharacterized protein n=1 Tax=Dactylellina haptotyla (strain CBS 200.50) TaxID=1284197 RepID=S8A8P7_DACHA|nr:hypothetical protein H072_6847 [Dactylellina haptotyla CBS 200.50]
MARLFDLPFEIKSRIFSEVIGDDYFVNFLFEAPVQTSEWRAEFGDGSDSYRKSEDKPCTVSISLAPSRIPTSYLLVSRNFRTAILDTDRSQRDELTDLLSCSLMGKAPYRYINPDAITPAFLRYAESGRLILAGYPSNVDVTLRNYIPRSVKSVARWLYLTKMATNAEYPGWDCLWGRALELGDLGPMFNLLEKQFLSLESISIGVCNQMGDPSGGYEVHPFAQVLEYALQEEIKKVELVYCKKGKGADNPLDPYWYCEDVMLSGRLVAWHEAQLGDSQVTRRGRYINPWDHYERREVKEEEEGDVRQIYLVEVLA